ncbi:ABC transporter ATP-binding protein [Aeromicrobium sp. IC_218]|uniref:ABC transporter ATP-binding protein n=1 Tax=Aeromicrobium sp. IC_218 TaxID=2545468 RepID=UPI00103B8958|nr:ABC transporter ATP-binding protein [Aeromicrobium sp. IC_218]TCI99402.1 ABC transporter ATP-binding protein [Aeromicrobium sp. IC_218]
MTTTPVLQARGLRRSYQSGPQTVHAVDGIDLALDAGEFIAVMGPSGSGKSTLMHLLAGLDQPSEGTVLLDGDDLTAMDDEELTTVRRRRMGFVFQSFNLVPDLTVRENLRLPLSFERPPVRPDGAWEATLTDRLGLAGLLERLPHELSGGQQQRVAIARALVRTPSVVFADEPTGNLDVATGRAVLSLLGELVRSLGCTVVMVTHDATAASHADRTLFLRDGRVVDALDDADDEAIARTMLDLVRAS